MKGISLTTEQKDLLLDVTFDGIQYYNPVLDNNDVYFISEQEVNQTTNPDTMWVKDLPLVDIQLKVYEEI